VLVADPILDLFNSAKGVTVDPDTVASQIQNLLHIVSGKALPDGSMGGLTQQTPQTPITPTGPSPVPTASQTTAPAGGTASPVEGGNMPINQPFHEGHAGVDIGVPVGSHMIAAITGTVTRSVNEPGGYGNLVEITGANGISVRYGHLSQIGVQQGQQVTAGQSIGVSGGAAGAPGAGNSTGPHLHFEVRQNGQPVDPAAFLAGSASIVGAAPPTSSGSASTAEPTPLSPEEILAAQVQNTVDILTGKDPTADSQPKAAATSTSPTQTATGQAGDTFGQILAGIGAPDTPENRRVLSAWQRAEGGSPDNPFNTTQGAPGATDFNSVGVKRYPDVATGVAATVKTLLNGYYPNIIAALKAGNNANAVADAIESSPWGTGGLVKKVLAG
jgi:hypothetical protein